MLPWEDVSEPQVICKAVAGFAAPSRAAGCFEVCCTVNSQCSNTHTCHYGNCGILQ